MDVDTNDTVDELISKVSAERVKKGFDKNCTVSYLTYAGTRMSGPLKAYNLKDSEVINYALKNC